MTHLITTGIMIIITLFLFKSGWLLQFLDNVPFISNVTAFVNGLLGLAPGTVMPGTGTVFLTEFLKSLIYLIIFSVVDKFSRILLDIGVGKREKNPFLIELIAHPLKTVASAFFSALFTCFVIELLNPYIEGIFNLSNWLALGVSTVTFVLFMCLAFFLLGKPFAEFMSYIAGAVIFSSVVKLISMEFIIVFLYYLLNVPEIFDSVGTLVILVIGISCCIGSIAGAEMLGKDELYKVKKSKH